MLGLEEIKQRGDLCLGRKISINVGPSPLLRREPVKEMAEEGREVSREFPDSSFGP